MPHAETYLETRQHELRKMRMVMVDGNLTGNLRSVQAGVSARAYRDGYWGFASAPADGRDVADRVGQLAAGNARTMAGFGARAALALPGRHYRGEQRAHGGTPLSAAECSERMAALHAHCMQHHPGLRSTRVMITDEAHVKRLQTEGGGDSLARIQRAAVYVVMVGEDDQGAPIELTEIVSGIGSLADIDWSLATLAPRLDALHRHLQAKRQAVPARGGEQVVVLSPDLAGMLAHEAMGHPCEADAVLSGAVTADLQGQRVASELISMVDLAHHWNGQELMCPVYVDDEGTPAEDVTMIERGLLRQFMHSRETAARLGLAPSGNARAYGPDDEPLVRMRNTAILPGTSTLDELIAGVDDGYLLLDTSNGQADATTEFMFGVNLAYEIRGGKLGRAVRDTTLSGSALKVLQSVDGVGREMKWSCNGYCGKKQPMVVSVGGPALRAPTSGANEMGTPFATDRAAEQVLAALQARGFEHAQVTVSESRRCELNLAHNEPSLLRSNESRKLAASGIVGGRRASAEGNDLSADGVATLVDNLWTAAGSAPPDEANAVSAGQTATLARGPREADPAQLAAALRTLLDWRAAQVPTMMIEEALAAHVHSRSHTVTSGGSAIACDFGWCELSVFGLAREGGRTSSFNHAGGTADALADVPHAFGIDRMMRELTQQVHTQPLAERFVGDVVLAPGAVADLVEWLMGQLGDGPLIDGSSLYRRRVGERIASPLLTLKSRYDAPGCAPLSADAFVAPPVTLLDAGVLTQLTPSLYGSRKTGLPHRPVAGHGWELQPGSTPLADIVAAVPRGALVDRLSMGSPAPNGDFSGVIKNSFVIEGGLIGPALAETMISGNVARMLHDVVAVSAERTDAGSQALPWLRIGGLHFS